MPEKMRTFRSNNGLVTSISEEAARLSVVLSDHIRNKPNSMIELKNVSDYQLACLADWSRKYGRMGRSSSPFERVTRSDEGFFRGFSEEQLAEVEKVANLLLHQTLKDGVELERLRRQNIAQPVVLSKEQGEILFGK